MPALTRPTFRPAPPKPISTASSNATLAPASARWSAADRPVYPPPTTAVSTLIDPSRPAVSGAGGAVNSQRPWDLALSNIVSDILVCLRLQGRVFGRRVD